MRRSLALLSALALALAPLSGAPASAQSSVRVAVGGESQSLNLPRGRSAAVDLPVDARDVIVSNPAVAEAMLHSPRRITVVGIAPGETDAVFLDASGRAILNLSIRVDAGVGALSDTIARLLPGSSIRAEAVNESIVLTGTSPTPAEADRAVQIARQFVSDPDRVLNLIGVDSPDQVTLRARIVEVQRSSVKQLGIDLDAIIADASDNLAFVQGSTFPINSGQQGGGLLRYEHTGPDGGVAGTLRAFERVGLVRTLAEPNLTAVSGENANFLAGGEFPVPVGRDQQGNILVEFKPYGVSLSFRPIVLSGGRISLQLSTEVSELSNAGALTLGGGADNAITLSGLNVRRAQTTVEMPSGGAMMIAGLLQESTRQNIDALPGMTSLPVLGALFRSRDYLMGETELVIIIEPFIVSPTGRGVQQTPADGLQIAGDAQTIFFGQLNRSYGTPAPSAASAGWQGPVGYVIE
ncbi:MAG: type II and III secretion system protein family protein [Brevundimonas sp.]|uniref:type II and III secretion system protein family protein n=1 Tax=Brevundimonas sp. TaxID=1871086 RepID=UPI003919ED77